MQQALKITKGNLIEDQALPAANAMNASKEHPVTSTILRAISAQR
jgi:hypothetical protein